MNYNSIHVSIKFDKCFILTFVVKSTPLTMKKSFEIVHTYQVSFKGSRIYNDIIECKHTYVNIRTHQKFRISNLRTDTWRSVKLILCITNLFVSHQVLTHRAG